MSTVVITGASSGIGLELTKLFLQRGDEVYSVCRENTAELAATKAHVISGIELLKESSYASLQQEMIGTSIDILVNNAGIFLNETLDNMPFEQMTQQFEVNALSPMKVTQALKDNLEKGSKVVMTTSRMGSISDNTSGSYYGYRASKAALNAFTASLAIDLEDEGIAVGLIHPGFVITKMTGFRGEITPLESAQGYIQRIDELCLKNSGGFWHVNGEKIPW